MVTEVAPGLHRMALPLGIHGVETVSAYLLVGGDGRDTLVDCGVAAATGPDGDPGPDGTAALEAALAACGSGFERIERIVVTHAHIDHFGLAGEVVRRSGGELWMHRSTELDLAKYAEPDEAVDRRELMLADHGLFGANLTETSRGLASSRYWALLAFRGGGNFATEAALTGRFFSAEEALAAGVIDRVAPPGEHLEQAYALARQIAANPPLSVRATVRTRRWYMDQAEREAYLQTTPLKLHLTEDFKESARAFAEKRPAGPFKGR